MPDEWAEYAMTHGEDPDEMFVRFAAHWLGKGDAMADWLATWQGWVRRQKDFRRKPTPINAHRGFNDPMARNADGSVKLAW